MPNGDLEKLDTGWHVPLAGATVSQITIDHAPGLLFWVDTHSSVHLKIETQFQFSEGPATETISMKDPAELGRFASLFGSAPLSADLTTGGHLDLRFSDAQRIEIDPDPDFEAFSISGGTGAGRVSQIICLPGGGLAEWLPTS